MVVTQNQPKLEGGCACGAVRYRMISEPLFVHAYHCYECQRLSGGAFAINALIETDRVVASGEATQSIEVPTASGRSQRVQRCAGCGTALWSHYGGATKLAFVRVGTLDDPASLAPDVHIFTASKAPWLNLPDGVPAFEAYCDAPALWPATSLARRGALFR